MRDADRPGRLLQAAAPFLFIVLWSSAYVAVRASLPDVSPLFFLTIRFALATAALLFIVATVRQSWTSLQGNWHHLVVAGVLINGLYLSGGYLALQSNSAATMALIATLHPMITASLAGPILNENMRPLQWFGLMLGLADPSGATGRARQGGEHHLYGRECPEIAPRDDGKCQRASGRVRLRHRTSDKTHAGSGGKDPRAT